MNTRALLVVALLASPIASALASSPAANAVPTSSLNFQVDDKTEVPDGVLKPGSYSIRVVDHLSDRVIVEIKSSNGGPNQVFLGIPTESSASSARSGPISFTGSKSKAALRGFTFPGGVVIDFVYPKNDAVALAKTNGVAVVAVDPASEGMATSSGLSAEERKMVTLWTLTPTPVAPDGSGAGIQAAKYQAPASSNSLRAEVKPPVIRRLPKTASMLPVIGILGLSFIGVAACLGFSRVRYDFLLS
jgi:hypothetical protein